MIVYDSHKWRTLLRLRGSVGVKATIYSLPVAAAAFVLKFFDDPERFWHVAVSEADLVLNSAAYAFLMSTTAFVLVFRTNQCYSRFWSCSTSICTFRAQLLEAAGSLQSFLAMSKKSDNEKSIFAHKSIRMFSLLHAMALGVIADKRDEHFPIIGIDSIEPKSIEKLQSLQGRMRVQLTYGWINAHVVKGLDAGLLNIPPPILSRVFQELEKAMIEYEQVMQVMDVLFPFPYAQLAVTLVLLQCVFTPFVMCYWTGNAAAAAVFTFLCVACLFGLELIATELENPFGDDDNDLPCHHFQEIINESLLLMLDPDSTAVPELVGTATSLKAILEKSPTTSFEGRVSQLHFRGRGRSRSMPRFAGTADDDAPIISNSLATDDIVKVDEQPSQPEQYEEIGWRQNRDWADALLHEQTVFHEHFLGALTKIIRIAQNPPLKASAAAGEIQESMPQSSRTDGGLSNTDWAERLLLQERLLHDQVLCTLTEILHRLDRPHPLPGDLSTSCSNDSDHHLTV